MLGLIQRHLLARGSLFRSLSTSQSVQNATSSSTASSSYGEDGKSYGSAKAKSAFAESIGLVPQRLQTGFSNLPLSLRDRERPVSPSFFTGVQNSTFHDFMLLLKRQVQDLKVQYAKEGNEDFSAAPSKFPTWITKIELQSRLHCKLRTTQYRSIVAGLNEVFSQPNAAQAKSFLDKFRRTVIIKEQEAKVRTLDEWGRMGALGRRKDSVAKVHVAEGTGEMLVNGQELYTYFPSVRQREAAIKPLVLLNKLDRFNVWVRTSGGGFTGQSEAITLGLARAMEYLDPATRPVLRKAGLLTRDSRVVEPKKPGRKKARKLKQWVKR